MEEHNEPDSVHKNLCEELLLLSFQNIDSSYLIMRVLYLIVLNMSVLYLIYLIVIVI